VTWDTSVESREGTGDRESGVGNEERGAGGLRGWLGLCEYGVLQRMAELERPKARCSGRNAPGQAESESVIGVTECSASGRIGSRERRAGFEDNDAGRGVDERWETLNIRG
jgi:hypothetical protein